MNQSNLKILVRGTYDVQKLRIQMGNRIVANFKAKLGQAPSTSEDELDDDSKEMLKDLRMRYTKITDGVTSILGGAKMFPKRSQFKGDKVISTYTELCLLAQYIEHEDNEKRHFSRLESILAEYPIYTDYLKSVKGVGPAMAGVIISEIDISKSKYPSSLWAYAGLDTAVWFELKKRHHPAAPEKLHRRHPPGYRTAGPARVGVNDDWFMLYDDAGTSLGEYGLPAPGTPGLWQGRSRKAEHLVRVKYTTKSGEEAERNSITHNPFLKSKVTQVLGSSFLRAGDNTYSRIYRAYKARLEQNPAHATKTKGHRHNMAIRFMVKAFLTDLHRTWRAMEGFEPTVPYQEAKAA